MRRDATPRPLRRYDTVCRHCHGPDYQQDFYPRNGSWKAQDAHKILNYKAFMPSLASAEQFIKSQQFQ
jgi:hypothetical protein